MEWNEKQSWYAFLVPFGIAAVFFVGYALGSGDTTYAIPFGTFWAALVVAWLFRLTFLAGLRRGDS